VSDSGKLIVQYNKYQTNLEEPNKDFFYTVKKTADGIAVLYNGKE
jgi:hypothetical protein